MNTRTLDEIIQGSMERRIFNESLQRAGIDYTNEKFLVQCDSNETTSLTSH